MLNKCANYLTVLRCFSVVSLLLMMPLSQPVQTVNADPELDNNEEIVYLTNEGQIQVLDTLQTGGATKIQWNSSDDKGYFDFTLGDVNNDGDKEIIAIKGNSSGGLLVVYDPVVTSGPSDSSINGVPWRKLVTINLLGNPSVVASGNFDTGVNGDEILIVYAIPGGSRLEVYHGAQINHDGTLWSRYIPSDGQATIDFDYVWRDASVGDVIAGGPQEVLLSSSDANIFRVYRFDGFSGLCERTDLDINDVAVGRWNAGDGGEIGVVRSLPGDPTFQFNRFLMFSCNTTTGQVDNVNIGDTRFRDAFALTAADVNGNGDDEFFMLRNLPIAQASTGAHLLGRNGGSDSLDFEVNLGGNFYQSITGGDVDGDGKDEVVIMRDNNIRVFTDPEIGADAKNRFQENPVTTNSFAIEIDDLDKNGYAVTPDPGEQAISNLEVLQTFLTEEDPVNTTDPHYDKVIPLIEGKQTFVRVHIDCQVVDCNSLNSGSVKLDVYDDAGKLTNEFTTAIDIQVTLLSRIFTYRLPLDASKGTRKFTAQLGSSTRNTTKQFVQAKVPKVYYMPVTIDGHSPTERIHTDYLWSQRLYPTSRVEYLRLPSAQLTE